MSDKTFFILPTNEGQELNYMETYKGTLESAKKRAKKLAQGLQLILKEGTIGCMVQNQSGEQEAYYDGVSGEF